MKINNRIAIFCTSFALAIVLLLGSGSSVVAQGYYYQPTNQTISWHYQTQPYYHQYQLQNSYYAQTASPLYAYSYNYGYSYNRQSERRQADTILDQAEQQAQITNSALANNSSRLSRNDFNYADDELDDIWDTLEDANDQYNDQDYDDAIDYAIDAHHHAIDLLNFIQAAPTTVAHTSNYYANSYQRRNVSRSDAKDIIEDAKDAIKDAEDEIEDADDDNTSSSSELRRARNELEDAEDALEDAEDAYDDRDYDEAYEFAKDAIDFAEDAEDEL